MKLILLNVLLLSLSSYAVEFEVIGDFRNTEELKNWRIESELENPKTSLTSMGNKALFFSRYKDQKSKLVKDGDWDFSKFTHFMADISTDGNAYDVSITDENGMAEGYDCRASFKPQASALISTIKIPVEEFECNKEGAVLDLEKVKKLGLSSSEDTNFSLIMESFWMEAPEL